MKVKLKKVHPSWNYAYPGEFTIGDELELVNSIIITKTGRKFHGNTLTKSFSNKCSFSEIFEKI